MKIKTLDYILFFLDLLSARRSIAEWDSTQKRIRDCSPYIDFSKQLTIIELGSGELRPQTTILSRLGHNILGIDLANTPIFSIKKALYLLARLLFKLRLPKLNSSLAPTIPSYITADVTKLPVRKNSIDFIASTAAFEHFLDIDSVLEECRRCLKPGGVIWISVHHYSSLSGGHNIGMRLNAATSLPENIEPWDHLRKRKLPLTVPLNQLRPEEYKSAISSRFEIIKTEFLGEEGKDLLSDNIRSELNKYTEEELIHPNILIVAVKK